MSAPNKYGVMNRLNLLESRCTALEQQNAELRTHLWTALETKINDKARLIQDEIKIHRMGRTGVMELAAQLDLKACAEMCSFPTKQSCSKQ